MHKDFDKWNKKKKILNDRSVRLYYHEREIWWCYLGVNVRTEMDGSETKFLRPCIVLRAFGPNACLIIPLTTSKRKHPLRFDIGLVEGQLAKANLSQMRVVDTNRLLEKMTTLDERTFKALRKAVKNLF